MNALRLRYYRVAPYKIAVLIIQLDAIQPDIVEIAMGRVEIYFEHETHWQGHQLILLEEVEWTLRFLEGNYLISCPALFVR